ncbi:MAG: glycerol kinase, partial [Gemmatimonadetes bacterium]|nr:glycerol kinase [Gemmatimonadota bacterium]NIT89024.1 glycerol kinase [Gemmatimonadota bacterium]NIU32815.1 glycerol kinase [Gemmatimonadota bacterium]NIV63181.1 glycerol kinase [Gemmatimonadota bacterium]NIW65899.1 glycerol kinase [Gemmatimonadota bacterium]
DWLMGFQAAVAGVPVRRPALVETTALGAAGLAGIATGLWESAADFLAAQGEPRRFDPTVEAERIRPLRVEWGRAVRAAVGWA